MSQFQARQEAEIKSLRHHIDALFKGTSDRLIRLGGALATMSNLGETLKSENKFKINSIVSGYASLGYELDLRRIELYTTTSVPVGSWAQFGAEEPPVKFYRSAIEKAQRDERPLAFLHCHPLCLLYAFVPILASGENVGVIVLGQSIADFIINFKLVTGADIALAVPSNDKDTNDNELTDWSMRIPALTDADRILPVLQSLPVLYPDPVALDGGDLVTWQADHYDIHRTPLAEIIPGQPGFILLISDVSQRLHDIEHALWQALLAAVAGLASAELILLYLIRTPLRRLSRLALTLPLLADGAYAQASEYFVSNRKKTNFQDEIDFLYDSAVQLSKQLEQNGLALASKNKELALERDFIQGLLASAQVLVITQTRLGEIRVGNDFVSQLTGYPADQLYGRRFVDLIADIKSRMQIQDQLYNLYDSGQLRMEHELELICKNGELRKVVWVHTPLREVYTDGTALLSVGLDITERVRAESKMRWLANHDPLTALINRHRFIEELNRAYDEARRTGITSALLVFDLDYFKEINDTSGHAAGDALLKKIADELKMRARNSDIVARLGGDEFAILMPQTDNFGAATFAKQLNERFAGTPFVYEGKRYRIGASIGIAFIPQHGSNVTEVMSNADQAMFEAKRAGRSRTRIFSFGQEHSHSLTQNIYWKDILLEAMESERLFFHFQSISDAKTGDTVFTEALIRLKMPDGRIAVPSEFLPSIERSGMNYTLDRYVIQTALEVLQNDPNIRLSINLSTAVFNDYEWIKPLEEAVSQRRIDPEHMLFEITETSVISDMEKAKKILLAVSALGFRFAVDDFGAGFSSLYYLKHLSVDYVKIDRTLIMGIIASGEDRNFVRAIVSMAHVYGRKVIAEGVENAATLDLLKDMNVDMVQGFYFGHPSENYKNPAVAK
ncbi:MAG: EAL domain-containing protein [Gammaproteobacteria bacterium]